MRRDLRETDRTGLASRGAVIFAKVHGSSVPVLLMRGPYGDWSSETRRYRSVDIEEVFSIYRWVPAAMQEQWASEVVAEFRRLTATADEPGWDFRRTN